MAKTLAALFAVLALACNQERLLVKDTPGGPRDASRESTEDAAIPQSDRDADFGNFPQTPGLLPDGTRFSELCTEGSTRGRGVMSGWLEEAPLQLEPTATLTRFSGPIPDLVADRGLPTPFRLQLRKQGLFVLGSDGFFDVSASGLMRFHFAEDENIKQTLLNGELDGDGDEDAVSIARIDAAFDGDGKEISREALLFVLWERVANGTLVQRNSLRSEHPFDSSAFALADYDGDGDQDLVGYGDEVLIALRNDSAFAFTELELREVSGSKLHETDAFADDRNGDGAIDLLLIGRGVAGTPEETWTFLNDGAGGFESPSKSDVGVTAPYAMQLGDVTGDGLADVVLMNGRDDVTGVHVARALDATSFDAAKEIGINALFFKLADVDGDGVFDIAASRNHSFDVALARGGLEFELRSWAMSGGSLVDIAVEPPDEARPARLHALFDASCRRACDEECTAQCIFNACTGCLVHNDCASGELCVSGACVR